MRKKKENVVDRTMRLLVINGKTKTEIYKAVKNDKEFEKALDEVVKNATKTKGKKIITATYEIKTKKA